MPPEKAREVTELTDEEIRELDKSYNEYLAFLYAGDKKAAKNLLETIPGLADFKTTKDTIWKGLMVLSYQSYDSIENAVVKAQYLESCPELQAAFELGLTSQAKLESEFEAHIDEILVRANQIEKEKSAAAKAREMVRDLLT